MPKTIYPVVALDLSLNHTGYCVSTNTPDKLNYGLIEPKNMGGMERLQFVRDKVLALIPRNAFVIMEGFSFGSRGQAVHQIAGVTYMIRMSLYERNIPFLTPPPKSLVKFTTGKGNGKKEHMLKALLKKPFELDIDDNNIADAIGLHYLGQAILSQWQPTTTAQREVVAKICKTMPVLETQDYNWLLEVA